MTQSTADIVRYSGVLPTLVRIGQEEGLGALFRGVVPRVLYLAPLAAIVYTVYSWMARQLLQLKTWRQDRSH